MSSPLGAVQRDSDNEQFLEAAARSEFVLYRCRSCGFVGGPQEKACPNCPSSEIEQCAASGGARVVSWSVVHGKRSDGHFEPQAVVVIGELDEGPWWWSQVIDAEPSDMTTGRRLRISFEAAEGGETLPVFVLD